MSPRYPRLILLTCTLAFITGCGGGVDERLTGVWEAELEMDADGMMDMPEGLPAEQQAEAKKMMEQMRTQMDENMEEAKLHLEFRGDGTWTAESEGGRGGGMMGGFVGPGTYSVVDSTDQSVSVRLETDWGDARDVTMSFSETGSFTAEGLLMQGGRMKLGAFERVVDSATAE